MLKTRSYLIFTLAALWLLLPSAMAAQTTDQAIVRAILFYSPTCPHCHTVINELLIPMLDEQGESLQIMGVDTTQPAGGNLYQAAIDHYQIPQSRRGVPTLIIGQTVLVGSGEIPDQFPGLVEEARAAGGIDWPNIPGLEQGLPPEAEQEPDPASDSTATGVATPTADATATSVAPATATQAPNATQQASVSPTTTLTPAPAALNLGQDTPVFTEAPPSDPAGFTLAGIIAVAMVVALGYAAWRIIRVRKSLFRLTDEPAPHATLWVIPVLAVTGLVIAVYLAYVEITHVDAVCGPIGQCNVVQNSPYAKILGIPVAGLGILNYVAVLLLWGGQFISNQRWANLSTLALLGLTLFGTLFSIYLTLLELFVIHAVCIWCLSSAIISTLLMLLVVQPVTAGLFLKDEG